MTRPSAGEIWEHFKGKRYRVLHVGLDTETLDEVVVYQHEKPTDGGMRWDSRIWVRPLFMWLDHIATAAQGRFVRVEEPPEIES